MKHFTIMVAMFSLMMLPATAQENSRVRVLSLQECKDLASGGNVNVRNTHLDYLSAKMQKREIHANYFPTVNAAAVGFQAMNPLVRIGLNDLFGSSDAANNLKYYLGTEASLAGISTTYSTLSNAFSAGLTLSQPVFAGGRIVNGNRLAALGIEAASLKEKIAVRETVTEVESKYWRTICLEEKMAVVEGAIALADSLLKDTRSAQEAGLLTDSEYDKVMMKRQDLRSRKVRLKGGIMLSRMDLCEAVGISTSEAMNLQLSDRAPVPGEPQSYWREPAQVVSSMEENRLLDMAVRQKKLEKNLAMGEALPQIGVGASYGYGKVIGSPQLNGAIFATVKIPITDWSKTSSKMKQLDYQKEKAENDRSHYASMLEMKVRKLWIEVEASWEELSLKEENAAFAEKAAKRTAADFSAGLATSSEVMEKQVALADAKCTLVDARITYRNALIAYLSLCSKTD